MSAQLDLLDAPTASLEALKPQCRQAIRLMLEGPGLTRLEAMHAGIGNLPARIGEIREAFGYEAVETRDVKQRRKGGSDFSRYFYHGPRP